MNRYYCKKGEPDIFTKVPPIEGGDLEETSGVPCTSYEDAVQLCEVLNQCRRGCLSNKKG